MGANSFNEMEIDAIGEIMNISLGASATAVSTMLGAKVNITTPMVQVQTKQEFEFKRLEPAVGVEISYTQGLEGKNIMVFRRDDVRIIVGMMMGMEIPEDEFQLDEINISAICEVMNQMMGSSATAMSEFLGRTVNISTPVSSEITDAESFKDSYFAEESSMVTVRFQLEIVGKLKSEFINIIPIPLAKHLLEPFMDTIVAAEKNAESGLQNGAGQQTAQTAQEPEPSEMEPRADETVPGPQPDSSASGAGAVAAEAAAIKASEAGTVNLSSPVSPEPVAVNPPFQGTPEPAAVNLSYQAAPEPVDMNPPYQAPSEPAAVNPSSIPPQPMMSADGAGGRSPQQAAAWMQPPVYGYPAPSDPAMLQLLAQMQQTQVQMMELMKNMGREEKPAPQSSSVIRPVNSPQLMGGGDNGEEEKANQEMLMSVPLEVSVEIGRTKKLVRDILEFTQGTLVVLDKMAGEQVDLFVNGQCIARGDIVVVEDNFGIRVTEIVSNGLNTETLQ